MLLHQVAVSPLNPKEQAVTITTADPLQPAMELATGPVAKQDTAADTAADTDILLPTSSKHITRSSSIRLLKVHSTTRRVHITNRQFTTRTATTAGTTIAQICAVACVLV